MGKFIPGREGIEKRQCRCGWGPDQRGHCETGSGLGRPQSPHSRGMEREGPAVGAARCERFLQSCGM